jgi:hypothetical protein
MTIMEQRRASLVRHRPQTGQGDGGYAQAARTSLADALAAGQIGRFRMGRRHTPKAAQQQCGSHSSESRSSSSHGNRSSRADNKRCKVRGILLPKRGRVATMALATQWIGCSAGPRIARNRRASSAAAKATWIWNTCNRRNNSVRARPHGPAPLGRDVRMEILVERVSKAAQLTTRPRVGNPANAVHYNP